MWAERFAILALIITCVLVARACAVEASLPPVHQDYDVYWEDPCVPAMRAAMEQVEPFLPTSPKHDASGQWVFELILTESGVEDLQAAIMNWRDTKLQCWRNP